MAAPLLENFLRPLLIAQKSGLAISSSNRVSSALFDSGSKKPPKLVDSRREVFIFLFQFFDHNSILNLHSSSRLGKRDAIKIIALKTAHVQANTSPRRV